jgi:Predicted phosphatase homologous to the C-terminal domain of histone macroH2A1
MAARISLLQGDITQVATDAIVNAANSSLMGGGGVDGAIHRAGGPAILEECQKIVDRQGGCPTSEAVITTAGKLPAKFVIHTVGPVWNGGNKSERELLASCYKNSLLLGLQHDVRSIAFPNISTGIYRFPKEAAAVIALREVKLFIATHQAPDEVIFVYFDHENYTLYQQLLKEA